jgi:hypothetical protein
MSDGTKPMVFAKITSQKICGKFVAGKGIAMLSAA